MKIEVSVDLSSVFDDDAYGTLADQVVEVVLVEVRKEARRIIKADKRLRSLAKKSVEAAFKAAGIE